MEKNTIMKLLVTLILYFCFSLSLKPKYLP